MTMHEKLKSDPGARFMVDSIVKMVDMVMTTDTYDEECGKCMEMDPHCDAAVMLNIITAHMRLKGASFEEMSVTIGLLSIAFNQIKNSRH